jgi:hypothetical protein
MIFSAVSVVLPAQIPDVWPVCKPLIESALATAPVPTNIDDIHSKLLAGRLELLVCLGEHKNIQAVLVLRYWPDGDGFVAHIQAAAGSGVSSAKQEWIALLAWLVRKRVRRVQLYCQAPQERLWRRMGFQTTYRVMSLDPQSGRISDASP